MSKATILLQRYFLRRASTSTSVKLRPYQEQCIEACSAALASGVSRIGVSLPTGSGKTVVFLSLLSHMLPPASNPDARRSLIIVNTIELARQSAQQASKFFPDWSVEIEQGQGHLASGEADLTIATYQTLANEERVAKFRPHTLKAIIVDEAHHAAARSYRRILSHFDSSIKHPDPKFQPPSIPHKIPILGFSATFSRRDKLSLAAIFQRIVYHCDFLKLINEKWLCEVRMTSVHVNLNLEQVAINPRTNDFSVEGLARQMNTDSVNELVVETWLNHARGRKSTLIFCVNIQHVVELSRVFRSHGIDARYVSSKTPAAERKDLVASFRAGHFPVLVNCGILTEGADIPNIDCVIIARVSRSENLFFQMIGRGTRLSPQTGKSDCHIIDFFDSASDHGVFSIPTLFGLDQDAEIRDETLTSLQRRAQLKRDSASPEQNDGSGGSLGPGPKLEKVLYTEHESLAIEEAASGIPPHIAASSEYGWVGCGGNVYVLGLWGNGHIRIDPTKKQEASEGAYFTAHHNKVPPWNKMSCIRSKSLPRAETLDDAFRGILRVAKWRRLPATNAQKEFLTKMWLKSGVDEATDSKVKKIARMTKGEASNIISRLKHGFQSSFEEEQKVSAKEEASRDWCDVREAGGRFPKLAISKIFSPIGDITASEKGTFAQANSTSGV